MDTELKRRFAVQLDTRGLTLDDAAKESRCPKGSLGPWLRRPLAVLYRKNLSNVAAWLGLTIEEAHTLQGGIFRRPPVWMTLGLYKPTWWKNPRKKTAYRRRKSLLMRGKPIPWLHTLEVHEKIAASLRGRSKPQRLRPLTRVIRMLNMLRAVWPSRSDVEIATRAMAILKRRGMSERGAKGLVGQAIAGKKGGRPRALDWGVVNAQLAAGQTSKQLVRLYPGTSAAAIKVGARRHLSVSD